MPRLLLLTTMLLGLAAASPGGTVDYEYDEAGRLVRADHGTAILDYEWDASGNLLRRTVTGADDIVFRDGFESGDVAGWGGSR